MVKNPPAMQETWVWSQGQEDPLEEGMATTPAFLPGESQGQRSLVGYSPWGHTELDLETNTIIRKNVQMSKRTSAPRKQSTGYNLDTL